MSVWTTLAEEHRWKPLGRGENNPYPCGSIRGWASPASLLPDESRYEDAGCVCHTDLERALIGWRREIISKLLERAAQISREEGISVRVVNGREREEETGEGLSERVISTLRELETARDNMVWLSVRMNLALRLGDIPSRKDQEQRHEPIDRPAPLAGPCTWTDKVNNPR